MIHCFEASPGEILIRFKNDGYHFACSANVNSFDTLKAVLFSFQPPIAVLIVIIAFIIIVAITIVTIVTIIVVDIIATIHAAQTPHYSPSLHYLNVVTTVKKKSRNRISFIAYDVHDQTTECSPHDIMAAMSEFQKTKIEPNEIKSK